MLVEGRNSSGGDPFGPPVALYGPGQDDGQANDCFPWIKGQKFGLTGLPLVSALKKLF